MPRPPQGRGQDDQRDELAPYRFHGLDLTVKGDDATGECPFCGREKFVVSVATGKARCWGCNVAPDGSKGLNAYSFVELLWQHLDHNTTDYKTLAVDRGIGQEALMQWGCVWHSWRACWAVPGYTADGKLRQLYLWRTVEGRRRLLATAGLPHQLYGAHLYDAARPVVELVEGFWDGAALWEALGQVRYDQRMATLIPTASTTDNALATTNVLALPGCNVFNPKWCSLLADKVVNIWFDNDHAKPHPKTGELVAPGSYTSLKRLVEVLSSSPTPPREIKFCKWGEAEYFKNLDVPDKFDVRDALTKEW